MLLVGLFVVSSVFGSIPASSTSTVSNESISMAVGNTTTVDETFGTNYRENETISTGGTTLSEGTDYEWYPSNQSVYWYGTTNVSDGGTASITYSFDHKPETARRSIGTISSAFSIGAVAVITLVASVILGLVGGFGGSRGRRR